MTTEERRALIVGVDHYRLPGADLGAAVADADGMAQRLARHEDGCPNYDCRVLADRMEDGGPITRAALRQAARDLFADFRGDVAFYFSGHGALSQTGGVLATYDGEPDDWGVPMDEIVTLATKSSARDVLLILDCCHSGDLGNPTLLQGRDRDALAALRENLTVIAASRPAQASLEAGGHGLFTAAVLDALDGGAADHMGWVTAQSIYAYVERRFGPWDQRPVYKSHATRTTVVRECAPLIERMKLRELVRLFPTEDHRYPLDPEHEPEDEHGNVHGPANEEKVAVALLLKDFRDAGLVKPSVPGEQLFWTARRGHNVELTHRGREYHRLVTTGRL